MGSVKNSKKTLCMLLFAAVAASVPAQEPDDSLYDKVKDYLGAAGLPRQEFLLYEGMGIEEDDRLQIIQVYALEDKLLQVRRYISDLPVPLEDGEYMLLSSAPTVYIYDGNRYIDPLLDGINGNERHEEAPRSRRRPDDAQDDDQASDYSQRV
ncbi:MAG: hypothetical protein ACOC32_01750 [Nanoarchaeota archaeon]